MENDTTALGSRPAVPQKVKIALPCDSAITFLGIFPRVMKTGTHAKTCTKMFMPALFINSRNKETLEISINPWHILEEYYLTIK